MVVGRGRAPCNAPFEGTSGVMWGALIITIVSERPIHVNMNVANITAYRENSVAFIARLAEYSHLNLQTVVYDHKSRA